LPKILISSLEVGSSYIPNDHARSNHAQKLHTEIWEKLCLVFRAIHERGGGSEIPRYEAPSERAFQALYSPSEFWPSFRVA